MFSQRKRGIKKSSIIKEVDGALGAYKKKAATATPTAKMEKLWMEAEPV
jgi:hypothetical protein